MTLRWQSIRVELVRGRGEEYDPPPGRILIIPPRTTFETLARAIDDAFARWDHSHLQQFTLPDGTVVSDNETLSELGYSFDASSPIPRTLSITTTLGRRLKTGDTFTYVFDFGDDWTHLCTVEATVDPYEVLGVHVADPTPFWGWGSIPDQHGRRWANDTGNPADRPPRNEAAEVLADPSMRIGQQRAERISGRELRAAAATGPQVLADTLVGKDLSEALQQVGAGLLGSCASDAKARKTLEPRLIDAHARLIARAWTGDDELADALLAVLQGRRPSDDRMPVPVDVTEAVDMLHDSLSEQGVEVNLATGTVMPVGLELDLGEEDEDAETLHLVKDHEDWGDLAAFAEAVEDATVREELEQAIEGRGAFSRFRSVTERHDLVERWMTFRDDRRIGRARAELALSGVRPRN